MPRSPAKFRQSDIARALRAAMEIDPTLCVRLAPDGSIVIQRVVEIRNHDNDNVGHSDNIKL